MSSDLLVFIASPCLTLGLGAFVAARRINGAGIFGWMTLTMGCQQGLRLLELTSHGLERKLLWDALQWLPAGLLPPLILAFCVRFVRDRIRPGHWAAMAACAAVAVALATAPWTGLAFAKDPYLAPGRADALVYGLTPLGYLQTFLGYGLLGLGYLTLHRYQVSVAFRHGPQIRYILAGLGLPSALVLLPVVGFNPFDQTDVTHIAYPLQAALIAYGQIRVGPLDVVPLALEHVVASLGDGLVVVDSRARIVHINTAFARLSLREPSQLVGRTVAEALPDLVHVLDGARDEHREELFLNTTARGPRWFDVSVATIRDAGRDLGRVAVVRDISRQKRDGEALVREGDKLARANAELEAYARTVAHDLKNPLNGVLGFSELLLDDVPADRREDVQAIQESALAMQRIIEELLLLARLRNDADVPRGPVDVRAVALAACHRLEYARRDHGGEFEVAEVEGPRVLAHAPWLEEVLVNYLSNALKYGGEAPRARVTWTEVDDAVEVSVVDWGPGVAPEHQASLFTEFTRLAPGAAEGHGLGLSVVKRIAERLRAEVGVHSEPGSGARFWIRLPRVDANAPTGPSRQGAGQATADLSTV